MPDAREIAGIENSKSRFRCLIDGRTYKYVRGVDFTCHPYDLINKARRWAWKNLGSVNIQSRIEDDGDVVWLQAYRATEQELRRAQRQASELSRYIKINKRIADQRERLLREFTIEGTAQKKPDSLDEPG